MKEESLNALSTGSQQIGGVAYPLTCHGVDWHLSHSMALTLAVMLLVVGLFGRQQRLSLGVRVVSVVMGVLSLVPLFFIAAMFMAKL